MNPDETGPTHTSAAKASATIPLFLHLTPISFEDAWYYLSFNHSIGDNAKPLGPHLNMFALQRLIAKYEQKLAISVVTHGPMAANAFRNVQGNADWNHMVLLLTVYDRLCWFEKVQRSTSLRGPFFVRTPRVDTRPGTAWDPTKRWQEDVQRFCREFGSLPPSKYLKSCPSKTLNQNLLQVAVAPSCGFKSSVESRFCLAGLDIRALVVRGQSFVAYADILTFLVIGCSLSSFRLREYLVCGETFVSDLYSLKRYMLKAA